MMDDANGGDTNGGDANRKGAGEVQLDGTALLRLPCEARAGWHCIVLLAM